jgi:serine/threonine protein kinase
MGQVWDEALKKTLCDRYQIQRQLGQQTGRRTFLAHDPLTQNSVVIKILTFDSDFEWTDLKLFEREAAILQSLSHPAIPRYLDYFEIEIGSRKGFALVQTYIEAKSLEEHLKAGRSFDESEIKQLAIALLEILRYLHDRHPSVIHRDIKPSNILLGDRSGNSVGQVYLVDFGSVQTIAARSGSTVTVVGTYGYMPPEQFGGRATPGSDLYSLGATLIYLVTGQHPADLPQKNLRIEFEPSAYNLSSAFKQWLQKMVEPSLEERFAAVQQALEELQRSHLSRTESTATQVEVDCTKLGLQKCDSGKLVFWFRIPKRLPLEQILSLVKNVFVGAGGFFILISITLCISICFPLIYGDIDLKTLLEIYLLEYLIVSSVPALISIACFTTCAEVLTPWRRKVINHRNSLGEQALGSEIVKLVVFPPDSLTKPRQLQLDLANGILRLYPGRPSGTIERRSYNLTEEELIWVAQEISNCWDIPVKTVERKSSQKHLR